MNCKFTGTPPFSGAGGSITSQDRHGATSRILVQKLLNYMFEGPVKKNVKFCAKNISHENQEISIPTTKKSQNKFSGKKPQSRLTCMVLPRPMSSPRIPPIFLTCRPHNHLMPSH